jgi:hypothetical protein
MTVVKSVRMMIGVCALLAYSNVPRFAFAQAEVPASPAASANPIAPAPPEATVPEAAAPAEGSASQVVAPVDTAATAPQPPPPAAVPTAICTPGCRGGFSCVQGRCVSDCNPACGPGAMCGADGQCLKASPSSSAESPIVGKQEHVGFSLRVSGGIGSAGARRDLSRGSYSVSGLSGLASLDIGGTPVDNLVVYGHLGGLAFNPMSDALGAGGAYFILLGPGARYYFMPFDWYAGGALGLELMAVTNAKGTVENARPGVGLELEAGKEWSAAAQSEWSVGLGLRFSYAHCPASTSARDPNNAWRVLGLSLVFSVTYD